MDITFLYWLQSYTFWWTVKKKSIFTYDELSLDKPAMLHVLQIQDKISLWPWLKSLRSINIHTYYKLQIKTQLSGLDTKCVKIYENNILTSLRNSMLLHVAKGKINSPHSSQFQHSAASTLPRRLDDPSSSCTQI